MTSIDLRLTSSKRNPSFPGTSGSRDVREIVDTRSGFDEKSRVTSRAMPPERCTSGRTRVPGVYVCTR